MYSYCIFSTEWLDTVKKYITIFWYIQRNVIAPQKVALS